MIKKHLFDDFTLFNIFTALFGLLTLVNLLESKIDMSWLDFPLILAMMATAFFMIFKKRSDEFSAECWKVATAAAFALVIVGPFSAGFISGLTENSVSVFSDATFADTLWYMQISLFISVFYIKRLRG